LKHLVTQISALALGIFLAGCSSSGGESSTQPTSGPTYYRDVKPVIDVKCTGCHVEGGIAPFPLTTLDQVTAQKAAIKGAVESGTMPPWPPADSCASYQDDRSLSADQVKTIGDWVAAGAPAGDPADKPVPVTDTRTTLSRVDRTLKMPVAYTPQIAPDDYRCFLVDWPDTDTSYITGVGVQPDHASIVHHVIAYLAKPDKVAEFQALDDADPTPGWTCFGGPGDALGGSGWVGAWAPGALGADYPAGTGIEIPPGSKIVLQIHYNTSTAKAVPDQSSIVLKVDKTVEKKAVIMPWTDVSWVLQHKMDIPAHSMDAVQSYADDPSPYMDYLAPGIIKSGTPFTLYSAGLHMHTRGTKATTKIERSGGGEECMLDIGQWNFHWQGSYSFDKPKTFNPGDKLSLECHWNNPDATDLNWGEGTGDEMCLAIYYATQ
jgi:hypothetical protein